MTLQHYTQNYLLKNENLNTHLLLILLLQEGTKLSLDYLIMTQYTGQRKQKGDLLSAKHHIKQLLII